MKNEEQQLDDYLNGNLTEKERLMFEEAIEDDKELKSQVALLKDIVGGIRLKSNKQLKDELNAIHGRVIEAPKKGVIRPLWPRYIIGIAATILLLVAVFFLLPKNMESSKELYATHFVEYTPDWDTRGGADAQDAQQVKQLYESKQYTSLLALLETEDYSNVLDPVKLEMIQGIAALETGQYEVAKSSFEEVEKNPLYQSQAQWYMALYYLKLEDIDSCRKALKLIVEEESSDYRQEALNLLNDL